MDFPARYKPSVPKVLLFSLLALVIGALHPLLLSYQTLLVIWLLPCIGVIAAVVLYAAAGMAPAICLGVSAIVSSYLRATGLGPELATATLPLTVLPAVVAILGLRARKPFFVQLRNASLAQLGGALAAIVICAMFFGRDMISQCMDLIRAFADQQLPAIYEIYRPVWTAQGVNVTYEEFLGLFSDVLFQIQTYYELYLASSVLANAALTGIISVLWGNWVLARHGEATVESFRGLADWHMPSNMTFGLLISLIACLILRSTGIGSAEVAWTTASALVSLAFCAQLAAANDRRLKAAGATHGKRTALGILLCVLISLIPMARTIASFGGAASALFGRQGAITQLMNKNASNE